MTSTGDWFRGNDYANVALVLVIDGVGYGFTNRADPGLSSAWSGALGDEEFRMLGALEVGGTVGRTIEMFAAKILPSNLSFSVLDPEEVLLPLMFGQGRTDIRKTYLTESVSAGNPIVLGDDVTQLSGATELYCGLETMRVVSDDGDGWTVNRGVRALFPRSIDAERGRSHEVPSNGGRKPAITDVPTNWLNREVGLFVSHRDEDGVWSAGVPGSGDNDAELIWAGRIRTWNERGDGWIDIDAVEITAALKTTIGARMYRGTLQEGMYLTEANAEMQVQVTRRTRAGTDPTTGQPVVSEFAFDTYVVTLSLSGQRVSHQQLAENIRSELGICFAGSSETYGPEGMSAKLNLIPADGHYLLEAFYGPANKDDTLLVEVSLDPLVWTMLGYKNDRGGFSHGTLGGRVSTVTLRNKPGRYDSWERRASELPKRFAAEFDNRGSQIDVVPDGDDEFFPQSYFPVLVPANTEGFLIVQQKRVVAVRQSVTDNRFTVLGELLGFTRVSDVENVGKDLEEFFDVADDGSGPIEVRQAWVEPSSTATGGAGGLGIALLWLILSSGSLNYNDPLWDRLPRTLGAAFPGSLVDVESFLRLPAIDWMLVVLKEEPMLAQIESALRVVGAHAAWKDGKLTAVIPGESAETADLIALTEANKAQLVRAGENASTPITQRTRVETNPDSIVNRMTLKYQRQINGSFDRTITVNEMASQSDFDDTKAVVVEALGAYDVGGVQSATVALWATNVAGTGLAYFSRPVAIATRSYGFKLVADLYPGARVVVEDLGMINPANGARGVTGLLGWVVRTKFDWGTGVGEVTYAFQPDAVTTTDTSRLAIYAPSARVDENYGAEDSGVLLDTQLVNAVGTSLSPSVAVHTFSGFDPTDVLVITHPGGMTYDAWSPWSADTTPPVTPEFTGLPWSHGFRVANGLNVVIETISVGNHPSAAAALAAFQAAEPFRLSGETTYKIFGTDPFTPDNRGGLSLQLDRYSAPASHGYEDDVLHFKDHEYSLDTDPVDLSWFQAGDLVRVVDLSPTDPDAPVEWLRTIATVDPDAGEVTFTSPLSSPAWPDRGHFVMEFAMVGSVTAGQRSRGAFIADAVLRSTGDAPNDANLWAGDVSGGPSDVPLEDDQPYRRLNRFADEQGAPLSVHKMHEQRDALNTLLAWHTRPIFVNEIFLQPVTHTPNGTETVGLLPPIWIPLHAGATRRIQVEALLAMDTATDGGATFRFMTSVATPVDGEDFEEPVYQDGTQYTDISVPETTTYAWYMAILSVPAIRMGAVRGCYATFDAIPEDPAAGKVLLAGLKVMEAPPA